MSETKTFEEMTKEDLAALCKWYEAQLEFAKWVIHDMSHEPQDPVHTIGWNIEGPNQGKLE